MNEKYVELPLYADPAYSYYASLDRLSYELRFYYNERMQQWIVDLAYSDGTLLVQGEAVVPRYPMFADYSIGMNGFFWLEPIGKNQNETVSNPYELSKYYRLLYFYLE